MLSVKKIHYKNITSATTEALSNIELLVLSGYISEAHQLSTCLATSGPWKVKESTEQMLLLERLHVLICWLKGSKCIAVGTEEAMSAKQVREHADFDWGCQLNGLINSSGMQRGSAGQDWGSEYFDRLDKVYKRNYKYGDYEKYTDELEHVLKDRLRKVSGRESDAFTARFINQELDIHENSHGYESHWLTDKLASCCDTYLSKSGLKHFGRLEANIFKMQLLLDIADGDHESVVTQVERLQLAEHRINILELGFWPAFRDRILAGDFRSVTQITPDMVAEYLEQFHTRKKSPQKKSPAEIAEYSEAMLSFFAVSKKTPLANCDVFEIPVPLSEETVLAMKVKNKDAISLWETARSLVKKTNRWPVLFTPYGQDIKEWLDRDIYRYESIKRKRKRTGPSVDDIVTGATKIDLESTYQESMEARYEDLEDFLSSQLIYEEDEDDEKDERLIASALTNGGSNNKLSFEQAAMSFCKLQSAEHDLSSQELSDLNWFEPYDHDGQHLLLLPTKNSWEVPAFMHWYGSDIMSSEVTVAQLKEWSERYDAEVIAHHGTILNIKVSKRPKKLDEAIKLAYQQDVLALEPPTTWFEARYSIQLSYGRSLWPVLLTLSNIAFAKLSTLAGCLC